MLLEYSANQILRGGLVSFTKNRPLPSHHDIVTDSHANWDMENGVLSVEVDSAKLHGAYRDQPKYKVKMANRDQDLRPDSDSTYVCSFHWPDWEDIIEDYKDEMDTKTGARDLGAIKDLVDSLFTEHDIQVNCTCPSFHWMGIKAKLQSKGAAMDDNRYPTSKDLDKTPKSEYLDAEFPLCKHLYAVLNDLLRHKKMPVIQHMLAYELKKEM